MAHQELAQTIKAPYTSTYQTIKAPTSTYQTSQHDVVATYGQEDGINYVKWAVIPAGITALMILLIILIFFQPTALKFYNKTQCTPNPCNDESPKPSNTVLFGSLAFSFLCFYLLKNKLGAAIYNPKYDIGDFSMDVDLT